METPINNVKDVSGLVDYFYSRLFNKYEYLTRLTIRNRSKEMFIASKFIESRMVDGDISKNTAIQECVDIIDTIFEYEEEFCFKLPIKDISILGQGKLSWITQKAVEIINRNSYLDMEKIIELN